MHYLTKADVFPDELHIDSILASRVSTNDAEAVHQVRVLIKRLRARLKLLRKFIPDVDLIRQIDDEVHDYIRALSSLRDLDVLSDTLRALEKKYHKRKISRVVTEIEVYIMAKKPPTENNAVDLVSHGKKIVGMISRINSFRLPVDDVMAYLKRRLRHSCKLGDEAMRTRGCVALHAWRKQVKILLYQGELLFGINPKLQKLNKTLSNLATHLGKTHDYCFIQEIITEIHNEAELTNDVEPLLQLLEKQRQKQLHKVKKSYRRFKGYPFDHMGRVN